MKWANLTGLLSPVAAILGATTFFPTPAVISAGAGDIVLQSGPARASLLELYTSEGCSSCPPAEAWLSRLRDDARLWKEIVPVAFHVDYWDNLGWKDRFASAAFTARQRDYAARWNSGSVYTPGFVLDGQEWRGWFTGRDAAVPGRAEAKPAGVLSITVPPAGRLATVAFQPAGGRDRVEREAFLAVLGFDVKSDVKAGENRGRALAHDFVVLSCEKQPLDPATGSAGFRLPGKPAGVGRQALAAWVVAAGGRGGPEQAAGGWLP